MPVLVPRSPRSQTSWSPAMAGSDAGIGAPARSTRLLNVVEPVTYSKPEYRSPSKSRSSVTSTSYAGNSAVAPDTPSGLGNMVKSMRPAAGAHDPATVIGRRSISNRLSPTFQVTSSPAVPHPGTNSAESSVYCPGASTLTGYATTRLAVTLLISGKLEPFSPPRSSTRLGVLCEIDT